MTKESKGSVHVVTGLTGKSRNKMLEEACRSSRLLRHFNPGLSQTIIVDRPLYMVRHLFQDLFDFVKVIDASPVLGYMGAKILALEYSDYDSLLILDNDTLPVSNIEEGFCYINNVRPLALSLAPRQEISLRGMNITNFQNGVMFVKRTSKVVDLFAKWLKRVCASNPKGPTRFIFSDLLSRSSKLSFYPLSYYWNFRVDYLLDFNVKESELKRILPLIKIFHTHLVFSNPKRQTEVVKMHPNFVSINVVGNLGI